MLFSHARKKNYTKIHYLSQLFKNFVTRVKHKNGFNGKNDVFSTCVIQNQKVY